MNPFANDLDKILTLAKSSLQVLKKKSVFRTGNTYFPRKKFLETFCVANKSYFIKAIALSRNLKQAQEGNPHNIAKIIFWERDRKNLLSFIKNSI